MRGSDLVFFCAFTWLPVKLNLAGSSVLFTDTDTHRLAIAIRGDLLSVTDLSLWFSFFLFLVYFAQPHGSADSSVCLPLLWLLSLELLFCFSIPFFFHQPQQSPESKRGWLNQFVLHLSVCRSKKRERGVFAIREAPSPAACLIVPPPLTDMQTFPLTSTHAKTKILSLSSCKKIFMSGSNEWRLRRKSLLIRNSFQLPEWKN